LNKEKLVCDIYMKAHFYLTMIAIEGWIPAENINELKACVRDAVLGTGNPPAALEFSPLQPIKAPDQPPTYFKTNKLTETFQGIVDTYGVPRYKEVNPALFTVITFPFLFGVMYGDIGHGTLLTLFSFFMIIKENSLEKSRRAGTLGEIPTMAFGGRYVMLLMGMFGLYAGTIYNDCLSIPLALYTPTFNFYNGTRAMNGEYYTGNNASYVSTGAVYPYGVDYTWAHKSNQLAFYNSMKMKMSVILGVIQMSFGIILSLSNHLYFKDKISAIFEFIPRMCFLLSTFGYMIFMIIYKWTVDWSSRPNSPPNLIQTMINMFLKPGSVASENVLYEGQAVIQGLLLLVAFLSVPTMLCCKPCIHNHKHKRAKKSLLAGMNHSDIHALPVSYSSDEKELISQSPYHSLHSDDEGSLFHKKDTNINNTNSPPAAAIVISDAAHHGEDFDFSDELIHNAIHTIEFVLGTVSNTASYLRLWALSLAHAQLAEVFWSKMMLQYGIVGSMGGLSAVAGFAIWGAATFAVLLCMDVLECFLHALRLHWVEFQNKFYYADGKAFAPFSFNKED
jgi:V-type H+-transporting ATPase subunit a